MSLQTKLESITPYYQENFIRVATEYDFEFFYDFRQISKKDIYKEIMEKQLELKERGITLYVERRALFKSELTKQLEGGKTMKEVLDEIGLDATKETDEIEKRYYEFSLCGGGSDEGYPRSFEENIDLIIEIIDYCKKKGS